MDRTLTPHKNLQRKKPSRVRTHLLGVQLRNSQRYESAAAISRPLDSVVRLILIKGKLNFGAIYDLNSAFIEDGLIFSWFVADFE